MNILDTIPVQNFVVIGSFALGTRIAKDIDIICMKSDLGDLYDPKYQYAQNINVNGHKVECLFADDQESLRYIYDWHMSMCPSKKYSIAPPQFLFAIKAGHIYFDNPQWFKHISDFHQLLKIIGSISIDTYLLIDLHRKCTEQRVGKQRLPRLSKTTVGDFFDDAVKKYIKHDDLHEIYQHFDKPIYTMMQKDPTFVDCSKEDWDNFTDEVKSKCVLEEAYVIATERVIIPCIIKNKEYNAHDAFMWAMKRICTTLTQGWFREYAVNHFFNIINFYYDKDFYRKVTENHVIIDKILNSTK